MQELFEQFPVVIEWPVAWGDMDAFQHVNNTVYFRYFESGRIEYFRRIDWPAYQEATGIGPILAATQARFRKPLTYPDTVLIAIKVTSFAEDRFIMDCRLFSKRLGQLACEGQATIVTYNYAANKKVPVPMEIRQRIEALEARRSSSSEAGGS